MKASIQTLSPLAVAGLSTATFVVLAATTALWLSYGDRVYFDTLVNGFASCFSF
ncbi:MAG: hypothetical protein AAGL24_23695 [Pseudomonadota bacterium]